MKRWKAGKNYEYILFSTDEFNGDIKKAIRYYDRQGQLVAIQILKEVRSNELVRSSKQDSNKSGNKANEYAGLCGTKGS